MDTLHWYDVIKVWVILKIIMTNFDKDIFDRLDWILDLVKTQDMNRSLLHKSKR